MLSKEWRCTKCRVKMRKTRGKCEEMKRVSTALSPAGHWSAK